MVLEDLEVIRVLVQLSLELTNGVFEIHKLLIEVGDLVKVLVVFFLSAFDLLLHQDFFVVHSAKQQLHLFVVHLVDLLSPLLFLLEAVQVLLGLLDLLLQAQLPVGLRAERVASDEAHVLVDLHELRLQGVADEELVVAHATHFSFLAGVRRELALLVQALAAEGKSTKVAML